MKEETAKKLFGNINYEEYYKLGYSLFFTTCGFLISGGIITDINNSISMAPFLVPAATTYASSIYVITSKNYMYTKDFSEVKNLYNEFINNYTNLNNTFELKTPIEIYSLYVKLLREGYLSQNKTFINNTHKNIYEIRMLNGTYILTGKGVCRHISCLFGDILKNMNYETVQIPCIIDYFNYYLKKHTNNKYDIYYTLEKTKNAKKPNHVITYANYEGFDYFIDPTNEKILLTKDNQYLSRGKLKYKILYDNSDFLNNKEQRKELKEIINKKELNISDEKRCFNIDKLYSENIDIFENFYKENEEIYDEVTSKLLLMKK